MPSLVGSDSEDSSSDMELSTSRARHRNDLHRVAKKSLSTPPPGPKSGIGTRRRCTALHKLRTAEQKFLENFDPETSSRERRKLSRKFNNVPPPAPPQVRKNTFSMYDEDGLHYTGVDLCDCLQMFCPGCHFPCPKCKSLKCGTDCRVNRKFAYDQIEYHGCDIIEKNPLN